MAVRQPHAFLSPPPPRALLQQICVQFLLSVSNLGTLRKTVSASGEAQKLPPRRDSSESRKDQRGAGDLRTVSRVADKESLCITAYRKQFHGQALVAKIPSPSIISCLAGQVSPGRKKLDRSGHDNDREYWLVDREQTLWESCHIRLPYPWHQVTKETRRRHRHFSSALAPSYLTPQHRPWTVTRRETVSIFSVSSNMRIYRSFLSL